VHELPCLQREAVCSYFLEAHLRGWYLPTPLPLSRSVQHCLTLPPEEPPAARQEQAAKPQGTATAASKPLAQDDPTPGSEDDGPQAAQPQGGSEWQMEGGKAARGAWGGGAGEHAMQQYEFPTHRQTRLLPRTCSDGNRFAHDCSHDVVAAYAETNLDLRLCLPCADCARPTMPTPQLGRHGTAEADELPVTSILSIVISRIHNRRQRCAEVDVIDMVLSM
jgi:hypothetical protein